MRKKKMSVKNHPPIQWVRPIQSKTNDRTENGINGKLDQTQEYVIFDEIFQGSKKSPSAFNGQKDDDSFHRAIGPVITVGQCFGIMPVLGQLGPDCSHLRFTWKSWRMLYTVLVIMLTTVMSVFCFLRIILTEVDILKTIGLIFFTSALVSLLLFLRLARRWPQLVADMARKETTPALAARHHHKYSLTTRFRVPCVGVLFLALIEHILSIVAGVAFASDCPKPGFSWIAFFSSSYPQVFFLTEVTAWKALVVQLINITSTFNWNFMDLFIIVVSLGLTDRFEKLNDRLEAVMGKNMPESFWRSAREEFAHLSQLVRQVDEAINEIILLSFTNNLYFICLQLFNSLKPLSGLSHAIYFTFSFGFLMARSIAVSLGAARLHSTSLRPTTVLYAVPSASYCTEVQRFLEQVTTDIVAFTGLNFFYVTRGLVLTIAGTVVTYELVLVQFNAAPPEVTTNITVNDNCGTHIKA